MNVLEQVVQAAKNRHTELMDRVKSSLKREPKVNEHEMLLAEAQECLEELKDPRYIRRQAFLKKLVDNLDDALQHVLAVDVKNLTKEDTLLKAIAIASRREAYKNLLNRSERVIQEYEAYQKIKGDK